MNCHRIPRMLIKDWEIKKGKIKYFCFKTNTFSEANTKSLFTEKNLLNRSEENFYNKYIETPLAHVVENSKNIENDHRLLKKWSHYRACLLLIYSIMDRHPNSERKLSDFDKTKGFIDSLIEYMYCTENKRVVLLNNYQDEKNCSPFVFNELGFFPIHYLSRSTCLTTFGVPINRHRVLTIIKEDVVQDLLDFINNQRKALVSNLSIGITGDKILIPPELIKHYTNEELQKIFIESRKNNMTFNNTVTTFKREESKFLSIFNVLS